MARRASCRSTAGCSRIGVAVSVYDGNTNDPKTFMPQVDKLK
jgi:hypothetical protein